MRGTQVKRLRKLAKLVCDENEVPEHYLVHKQTRQILNPRKGVERQLRRKWCASSQATRSIVGPVLKGISENYLTQRDLSLIMSLLSSDINTTSPTPNAKHAQAL